MAHTRTFRFGWLMASVGYDFSFGKFGNWSRRQLQHTDSSSASFFERINRYIERVDIWTFTRHCTRGRKSKQHDWLARSISNLCTAQLSSVIKLQSLPFDASKLVQISPNSGYLISRHKVVLPLRFNGLGRLTHFSQVRFIKSVVSEWIYIQFSTRDIK